MKIRNHLLLLGLILIQVEQSELIGQSNGSPPVGVGQAQATATLPAMPNGGGNSAGVPAGIPEPSAELDGFVWDGKKFTLGNARIFSAKFTGYLNEPEEDLNEEKSYQEMLRKILDSLDVFRVRSESKSKILQEILPLLQKAMRNPRDSGQCRAIYNSIGSDYHGRDNIAYTQIRLKQLAKDVDSIRWNMQVAANPSDMDLQWNPGTLSRGKVKIDNLQTELEQKLAEMKSLSEHTQTKVSESRIALQRVIVSLFLSRHFDHVMLATSIYRFLYSDGAGGIEIEDSVISAASAGAKKMRAATSYDRSVKSDNTIGYSQRNGAYSNNIVDQKNIENGIVSILPNMSEVLDKQTSLKLAVLGNIPKEMSELESATQELIDQTNRMMKSVKTLMAQGLYEDAMQRLQEAFLPGEHLSALRTFPWEKRQNLWKYLQEKQEIFASVSSKDYASAVNKIEEMKRGSKDNPFVKELSEVKNLQGASDMYIAKAKEAASRGDSEGMNKSLEEAAKIWPQNPALKETIQKMNQLNQGKDELKKLLQQKNYKYIMDEKARFLAASSDEPALLEQLKNVLETQGKALAWKARAEELLKRGDPYGAWEEAEKGIGEHPENTDLMKLRSDAAVKCPEYVDKIERARSAESKDDPAAALASYLAARQIYPQSALARDGIASLSKKLLAK